VEQRRRLGLRDDEAYVKDLHAQHEAGSGSWSESWGFLMTPEEESSIWARQEGLQPAIDVARRYLSSLPRDQAGSLRSDAVHGVVVIQVTRDTDRVRKELQAQIGDGVLLEVERVRFSQAELEQIAARVQALAGLKLSGIGADGGNDHVDIVLSGDPEQARLLIEQVADPCSFTLTQGEVVPLGGGFFLSLGRLNDHRETAIAWF
jgi:hypothetical protein